jgi:UDP-N-acetylmuramate dehydrogenase
MTLPPVRGRLEAMAPLAHLTWLRVGGPAEHLFVPADVEDLADLLRALPEGVPVTPLGVASNVLVRDGGVPGVVVRFGGPLARVVVDGDRITAGAGCLDRNLAAAARRAGLGGLEFFIGIPGTVGGALVMNAGCFGGETRDVLESATVLDRRGRLLELGAGELGLGYRRSHLPEGAIVVQARFRGTPDDEAAIAARMDGIKAEREASQPLRVATGGSTFKNPDGGRAWELIERAGCRGLRRGAAMVSEKHCNFLINTGGATAAELEALGLEVRRRVREATGVELEWEIRRIGRARAGETPA